MSGRTAFRPKAVDINRPLAIARDVAELDRPDLGLDPPGSGEPPPGTSQIDPLVSDLIRCARWGCDLSLAQFILKSV